MTIPRVDPYYRVEVDAGGFSWVTEKGDAAGYGLADPVRVSWSLPNTPLFHAQPDPMVAAFSVVVAQMSDVAGLNRGDAVDLRVYAWPPGTPNPHVEAGDLDPVNYPPVVIFRGRVSDIDAAPHKLGMVVTYSCVDYSVDLAEVPIGADDWPQEDNSLRLGRMFDEAGVLRPAPLFMGAFPVYFLEGFSVAARPGSPTPAREAMWHLVDLATNSPDDTFGTYAYARTHYAAGLLAGTVPDPLQPFDVSFANGRHDTGDTGKAPRLPGVLAITAPGKWGVDIVEDVKRRAAVIDADHVDFKAKWSQNKRTTPDTVTVTGEFVDASTGATVRSLTVAAPDAIPIGASLPCEAVDTFTAQQYAAANLQSSDSDNWTAQAFVWYADQDPWPLIADAQWFIEGAHVLASRAPIVVAGIPPEQNPTGVDWYAGRLRSASFTLAKGRYAVTFQLSRTLLRPQNFDASLPGEGVATLAYNDLSVAPYNAIRWADLDPAFSHFDYRLVRSP